MINHVPVTSCSLILTEGCNLNCTYCFEKDKDHKAIMTKEIARQSVDFLVKEALTTSEKHFHMTYFGGEPLLNMPVIRDSFDYAVEQAKLNDLKFDCMIITNATIYNEEVESFMIHWYNTLGEIRLQLSIDGIPSIQDINRVTHAGAGSSKQVEETVAKFVNLFKTHHIPMHNFSVHSVLTKQSMPYVVDSYKYFKSLGIDNIWNMPLHEEEWEDQDVEEFKTQLTQITEFIYDECIKAKNDMAFNQYASISRCNLERPDKPCAAGCNFITITHDGQFYPCHHFYFADKELRLGSLEEGVQDDQRMLFVDYSSANLFGDKSCESCANKRCYTCIAANYAANGNMLIGFPGYCKLSRAEDEIRIALSLRLEKAGVHRSPFSNGSNKKSCSCNSDGNHECSCGNNEALLEEVLKDREFLRETVKLMDGNIQTLAQRLSEMDEKVNSLLDVVTLVAQVLVAQTGGEQNNE